jgi:DNA-binding XRE family transcriptional regulator
MPAHEFIQAQARLGLSSENMGLLIGVARGTVTNYRNGHTTIPPAVARLVRVYVATTT